MPNHRHAAIGAAVSSPTDLASGADSVATARLFRTRRPRVRVRDRVRVRVMVSRHAARPS